MLRCVIMVLLILGAKLGKNPHSKRTIDRTVALCTDDSVERQRWQARVIPPGRTAIGKCLTVDEIS